MVRNVRRLSLIALFAGMGMTSCVEPTAVLDATMTVIEGEEQTGSVNQPLADSLAVQIIHRNGLPLENITVQWEAETGGGSVSPATSLTDGNGVARARRTLGSALGEQTTTARVAGLGQVRISHTAVP